MRVPLDETVVDSLPYGLVVVQADHTITSSNATARRFLPQLDQVDVCHEAFSCRVPGGPCEHGCLAARAVARQGPLPEIRIDMPPGDGQITAVWVTAAAVGARPRGGRAGSPASKCRRARVRPRGWGPGRGGGVPAPPLSSTCVPATLATAGDGQIRTG